MIFNCFCPSSIFSLLQHLRPGLTDDDVPDRCSRFRDRNHLAKGFLTYSDVHSQAPSHIALYISLRCKMQPDFPPSAWNQSGFLRWAGSNALWPLSPTGEPSSWHEIVQFGVGKKLTRMHEMCEPKSYLCFKAFTWTSMLRFEGGSGAVVIEAENINKL